jgi:N-methylhydantoinase B
MKLTIWREGDHAWFDWSGTDPQAVGPINFYLSEGMFKMFIGVYLIMVNDPQILFNDGFYPLLHVVMPEGCAAQPPLPGRARLPHARAHPPVRRARRRAVQAGAGAQHRRGLRHLALHALLGWDEAARSYYAMEILYGGIPGRPIGDGMDGHSWWPLFENIPTEYLEAYYPLRIDGYTTVTDSGGAGLHRGGNGVEKRYVYLEPGQVSIHDDRWLTRPWGVLGRRAGSASSKLLRRSDGTEQVLPAKCDEVEVAPATCSSTARRAAAAGRTGSTGRWRRWRATSRTASCRARKARSGYGVVLDDDGTVDAAATEAERAAQRDARGPAAAFDFGPELDATLGACEAETGLPAPRRPAPLRWSPLEDAGAARDRVRRAWEAEVAAGDGHAGT